MRIATPLRLSTMSVTSSRTPATEENSCSTLSICTRGDRRALQRRHQHAAQRVAQRQAEAALQRFGDTVPARRVGTRLDVKLRRLDQFLPVLVDHACRLHSCLSAHVRKRQTPEVFKMTSNRAAREGAARQK
jgi:hypothetical protein